MSTIPKALLHPERKLPLAQPMRDRWKDSRHCRLQRLSIPDRKAVTTWPFAGSLPFLFGTETLSGSLTSRTGFSPGCVHPRHGSFFIWELIPVNAESSRASIFSALSRSLKPRKGSLRRVPNQKWSRVNHHHTGRTCLLGFTHHRTLWR